jgi:hypothetical protein
MGVASCGREIPAAARSPPRPNLGTGDQQQEEAMNAQAQVPLPYGVATREEVRCVGSTARLLASGRLHLPREHVGLRLHFADGTCARVFRETVVERGGTQDPCVLLVAFRLRLVRGKAHAIFRWESLLNTPLFVGFPGFVSKLWLANDERDVYRGLYEWDGPARAERYARSLWRVLALGCVPSSIHYHVLPGLTRNALLAEPDRLDAMAPPDPAWWRLVSAT